MTVAGRAVVSILASEWVPKSPRSSGRALRLTNGDTRYSPPASSRVLAVSGRMMTTVAGGGTSADAARVRRGAATDPALEGVLRTAGFEVTEAGRQRWRRQLAQPIPPAALDEARRLLDRARGRAA